MATTLGIKVDDKTRDRLARIADALDRTPHWVLKAALESYLDREEARLAEEADDSARWERHLLTGEAVPHETARAWLESLSRGETEPCPR